MQYDPIKKRLGDAFNKSPWRRKLFYRLLDLLLLRTWHVKKALRVWVKSTKTRPKSSMPAPVLANIPTTWHD